jgi:hypothetical protein
MIGPLLDQMLGPIGRFFERLYLDNAVVLGLLIAVWMAVVAVGLHGVYRLRGQQRQWISRELAERRHDPAHPDTAGRVLADLEDTWLAAAGAIRWMPTRRGWWTKRATPLALREAACFTETGVAETIDRITGRNRPMSRPARPLQS